MRLNAVKVSVSAQGNGIGAHLASVTALLVRPSALGPLYRQMHTYCTTKQ